MSTNTLKVNIGTPEEFKKLVLDIVYVWISKGAKGGFIRYGYRQEAPYSSVQDGVMGEILQDITSLYLPQGPDNEYEKHYHYDIGLNIWLYSGNKNNNRDFPYALLSSSNLLDGNMNSWDTARGRMNIKDNIYTTMKKRNLNFSLFEKIVG